MALKAKVGKKSLGWYLALTSIALVIVAAFVFLKFYLLALVIAFAFFTLARLAGQEPGREQFSFSSQGLSIKNRFYPMTSLKSYHLDRSFAVNWLYLETTRRFLPTMVVFLGRQDPEKIDHFLRAYLPSKPNRFEEWSNKLAHWLKL